MPPVVEESGPLQERGYYGWKKQEEVKDLPPVVEEHGPLQERGACGWKKQKEATRFAAFVEGTL